MAELIKTRRSTDGWPEAFGDLLEVTIIVVERLLKVLDELDEAQNIPGLPKGMKIKRVWISSVDECVAGAELERITNG